MKKVFALTIVLMLLVSGLSMVFAAKDPMIDGALPNISVTSWYNPYTWEIWNENSDPENGPWLLDTAIMFDFDKIDINDIQWIRFSLYDENDLILAQRFSSNNNLVNLLGDAAQYWGSTQGDYANITGQKWLSCAFRTAGPGFNNGYWVSSGRDLAPGEMPAKLLVEVKIDSIIYRSEWIK